MRNLVTKSAYRSRGAAEFTLHRGSQKQSVSGY
jgi:hypothetical protein